jgi:DNA-binding LacI/PurR family transcriptional regulator
MKRFSSPSAHDVAHLAGVSQAAVSRAFTPGASIAKETRVKVLHAARSLGYRPNLLARSLIKGESGIIGIVIGFPRNSVVLAALNALLTRLSHAGKHILVFAAEDTASADVHAEELFKYRVDALILIASSLSPTLEERCHDEGVLVIFLNRRPRASLNFASVVGDNRNGGRTLAAHLLAQGYRRPAIMVSTPDSSTGRERQAGFKAGLAAHDIPEPHVEAGGSERDNAIQAARKLLSRSPRPDAIFCVNDEMALATIEVARSEFSLAVGPEIGIAGFDDTPEASWRSFELTSYSLPVEAMIERAVTILLSSPRAAQMLHDTVAGALKPRSSTQRGAL